MKKILSALFIATGLAVSAQAVNLGVEAGYLIDSEEEYVSARFGFEFKAQGNHSHQLEVEVGYSDAEELGLKAELLPVTANYRLQVSGPQKIGYHLGAGAGCARTRIDGVSTGGPIKLSDNSFVAQAFAGVTYAITPAATLGLGARYIWVDDVDFGFGSVEMGDDVAVGASLNVKF